MSARCSAPSPEESEIFRASQIGIDEVVYQLGFQYASSFYRAFRDWEGVTAQRLASAQWRKVVLMLPLLRDKRAVALLLAATLTILSNTLISPALPGLQAVFKGQPSADLIVPLLLTAPSLLVAMFAPFAGALADRFVSDYHGIRVYTDAVRDTAEGVGWLRFSGRLQPRAG